MISGGNKSLRSMGVDLEKETEDCWVILLHVASFRVLLHLILAQQWLQRFVELSSWLFVDGVDELLTGGNPPFDVKFLDDMKLTILRRVLRYIDCAFIGRNMIVFFTYPKVVWCWSVLQDWCSKDDIEDGLLSSWMTTAGSLCIAVVLLVKKTPPGKRWCKSRGSPWRVTPTDTDDDVWFWFWRVDSSKPVSNKGSNRGGSTSSDWTMPSPWLAMVVFVSLVLLLNAQLW